MGLSPWADSTRVTYGRYGADVGITVVVTVDVGLVWVEGTCVVKSDVICVAKPDVICAVEIGVVGLVVVATGHAA